MIDIYAKMVRDVLLGVIGLAVAVMIFMQDEPLIEHRPAEPTRAELAAERAEWQRSIVREIKESAGQPYHYADTTVDPIEQVQTMPSTWRNITIEGSFGTVTIVGDDAERFIEEVFPNVHE